eukprot:TRINITY_DN4786_c1_g2_i1.p1 TRINITY_DN4786_c1_g2~~TRINITY_DN4786_c1_g2_i1.p1  ORF type:complete len:331 (+),score=68.09 TRINITY_DN4786_c1_g2_i1:68-994(+)
MTERSLEEVLSEARNRTAEFSNVCFKPVAPNERKRMAETEREREWTFEKIREVVVMYMDYLVAPLIQQNAKEVKRTVDDLTIKVAQLQRKVDNLQQKAIAQRQQDAQTQQQQKAVVSASTTVKSETLKDCIPMLKLDSSIRTSLGSSFKTNRLPTIFDTVSPLSDVPRIVAVDGDGGVETVFAPTPVPIPSETDTTTSFEGSDTTSPAEITKNVNAILKSVRRRSASPPPIIPPDIPSENSIDRVDSAFGPLAQTTNTAHTTTVRFASPNDPRTPLMETFTSMNAPSLLSPESSSSEATAYEDDPTEI